MRSDEEIEHLKEQSRRIAHGEQPKKQNRYDAKAADYLSSKTFRVSLGCFIALIVFPIVGSCCAIIVAPAFAASILKALGLQ